MPKSRTRKPSVKKSDIKIKDNKKSSHIMGYCMKCKDKRDFVSSTTVTMKNGRKALTGKCIVCGTKMFRII